MKAGSKKRKAFIIILALALFGFFYWALGYPMAWRVGDWKKHLGRGPAGPALYRVASLIHQTPSSKEVAREPEEIQALEEDGNLSQNSPYPMSVTLGEPRYRLMNRPVLMAAPPSRIAYRLKLPPKARLEFGYGVRRFFGKKLQPGAQFIVEWQGPRGTTRIFQDRIVNLPSGFWEKTKKREQVWQRYLHPVFDRWGDAYRDAQVDLEKFAGEEGELRFITEPLKAEKGERFSPAVWSAPEVWAERENPSERPPLNVVLFVIEATPVSMVEPYNANLAATPNLKKFAERGVVFDKYFTVGDSTQLSTYCIFTGRHYRAMGLPNEMYFLAPMVKARFYQSHFATLTEAFSRAGYKTAMIGSNLFFLPTRAIGLDLGFDELDAMNRRYYTSTDTMMSAMEWLRNHGSKPFMLYIHYDAPHDESKPCLEDLLRSFMVWTPDFRWTFRKNLAQEMNADQALGRLLSALDTLGLRERTLVIVTADHGNCVDPAHNFAVLRPDREPWWTPFQHGRTMLAEDIHVPLIVGWPLGAKIGRRVTSPAASVDLFPSLVDLLLPAPAADFTARMKNLDGVSFADSLRGEDKGTGHDSIYSVSIGGESLILNGRYHYFHRSSEYEKILYPDRDKLRVVREGVFDLDADPRELHDLSAEKPEFLETMRQTANQARPPEPLLRFLYFNFPAGHVKGKIALAGPPSMAMTFPEGRPAIVLNCRGAIYRAQNSEGADSSGSGAINCAPTDNSGIYDLETDLKGPAGLILDQPVLWMELNLDGAALPVALTRLGPYGLPLIANSGCSWLTTGDNSADLQERIALETCSELKPSVLLAIHHPLRYVDRPGLYFYTMKFTDFIEETFSDQQLSPAVRSVLKQWGYIE